IHECEKIIQKASGNLIKFSKGGRIRFKSQWIQEYIASGTSAYTVSIGDAHEYLSRSSWDYLSGGDIERDFDSPLAARQSICKYFIENCVAHARAAEARGRSAPAAHVLGLIKRGRDSAGFLKLWGCKYSELTKDLIRHDDLNHPLFFCARFG